MRVCVVPNWVNGQPFSLGRSKKDQYDCVHVQTVSSPTYGATDLPTVVVHLLPNYWPYASILPFSDLRNDAENPGGNKRDNGSVLKKAGKGIIFKNKQHNPIVTTRADFTRTGQTDDDYT